MNWLIPKHYINLGYKYYKCKYCGNETILNLNIRAENNQNRLMNLDGSPHRCWESNLK